MLTQLRAPWGFVTQTQSKSPRALRTHSTTAFRGGAARSLISVMKNWSISVDVLYQEKFSVVSLVYYYYDMSPWIKLTWAVTLFFSFFLFFFFCVCMISRKIRVTLFLLVTKKNILFFLFLRSDFVWGAQNVHFDSVRLDHCCICWVLCLHYVKWQTSGPRLKMFLFQNFHGQVYSLKLLTHVNKSKMLT